MFKNRAKGKFIAIEGLSGSGATTQAFNLKEYFKKKKINVNVTREPTSDLIGGIIRAHLSKDWKINSPVALQLLFAADRANHLNKEIVPDLDKGVHVICDRYFLSSVAYGSIDINDQDWLYQINDQFILPDLTILIKVSAKTGTKRVKENDLGVSLFNTEEKLQLVWKAYENISKKYANIVIIDGEKSEEEVFEDIRAEVEKIIK